MDVSAALPGVPTQNLGRMPRAEFGRVWTAAEQLGTERGPDDWYLTGIVITLRWIAGQAHHTPVTRVVRMAMPETFDAEYLAALATSRSAKLHPTRAEMARGAIAVLGWMYHRQPEPSLTPLTGTG